MNDKPTAKTLAKDILMLMVLDLEYSNDLTAMYGQCPIRHTGPWEDAKAVLGEEDFTAEVARLMESAAGGNSPVKTNPWLMRQ